MISTTDPVDLADMSTEQMQEIGRINNLMVPPGSLSAAGGATEESLAREWIANHGLDWRYDYSYNSWFYWNGNCWKPDKTQLAQHLIGEHLRKADFFDTEKFPKMTFKSKKVKSLGKGKFALVGDLTMKGVTKEVTLDVEGPSAVIKDGRGGTKVGASASTKINRKDFGLSYGGLMDNGGAMIGDEVKITLEIEADKAKEAAKAPEKEAAKAPEKGAAK